MTWIHFRRCPGVACLRAEKKIISQSSYDKVKDCGREEMKFVAMVVLLMLLGACAGDAMRKIDWKTRIGHYTLDDARRELGVPESCVGLDDGGTACSWTISKGRDALDRLVLTFTPNSQLATANNVHF